MKLFLGFGLVSLLASGCASPSGKCTTPEGGIVLNCGEDTATPDSDTHTGETDTSGETGDSDSGTHTGDSDTDTGTGPIDADADGYADDVDCDDSNAEVHPDAVESCNGIDDNCDGGTDEGVELTWYADGDSDGYGDASISVDACDAPIGYVADATDCDDSDADIHPYAEESCDDTADKNCDGSFGYSDADGDLVPACEDCDDTEPLAFPGGTEVCDAIDNDCNTFVDDDATDALTFYADGDGDTYGDPSNTEAACSASAGYVSDSTDCNDTSATVHPGATEVCNEVDDDCDGGVDEESSDFSTFYADVDGDSYGDFLNTETACSAPAGYVSSSTDCDDGDAGVNPSATEVCNEVDDDCDGDVDEAGADGETVWYVDADGDGFGDAAASVDACGQPAGYVADSSDCNDASATVYPGAYDMAGDGIDSDCDGADTSVPDSDGDGDPDSTDCDNSNPAVYNGALEICNGIDDDCDGGTDEYVATTYFADNDADGYGDPLTVMDDCTAPSGYVTNSNDCDDTEAAAYTGAPETCDGVDNDCDGNVDEGVSTTYYADGDGDGYGDPTSSMEDCTSPWGYVLDATDCDDTRDWAYPGGSEVCWEAVDADCDGISGECWGGLTGPNLFAGAGMGLWNMEDPIGSGTVAGIVTVSGSAATSDCATAMTDTCSAMLQGPGIWTIESSLSATAGDNMFCYASLLGSDSSVPTTVEVYRGATLLTSVSHEAFDGGWTPTSAMSLVVPASAGTITMRFALTGSDAVWVDAVDCQQ